MKLNIGILLKCVAVHSSSKFSVWRTLGSSVYRHLHTVSPLTRGSCHRPSYHGAFRQSPLPSICAISAISFATVSAMSMHVKARCELYPRTQLKRFPVPDDQVSWDVDFPGYEEGCLRYTSKGVEDYNEDGSVKKPVWSDNPDPKDIPFNVVNMENKLDRRSYTGKIITENVQELKNCPRNPVGRTGVKGRGCLGRWGPNHAADPLVTRWKRDENNKIITDKQGRKVAQFVCVKRSDNGEWALPGGMVNAGENRTVALVREFGEEALNSLEMTDEEKHQMTIAMRNFFKDGKVIYRGYVDDPRNTDNAWMETKAINFHDETGKGVGAFKLHAGDDAVGVQWMDIDSGLNLYASHEDFIRRTAQHLQAHW